MERTAHYEQYLADPPGGLIPAMGCTEPVAIALAAAKAREARAQCGAVPGGSQRQYHQKCQGGDGAQHRRP